jgi:hypothetical protein
MSTGKWGTLAMLAVQVAMLVVMAVTLYPLSRQSESANKQVALLGNQTAYLAEQTRTIRDDYEKRTRPYLVVGSITVDEGNSSEYRDIVVGIQNLGQLPATDIDFGSMNENPQGIVISGEDFTYDSKTHKFYSPPSAPYATPASSTVGKGTVGGATSLPIGITARPYYIPITKEDLPTDFALSPGRTTTVRISARTLTYEAAISNAMSVAFIYRQGNAEYYYIARASKGANGSWIVDTERGN